LIAGYSRSTKERRKIASRFIWFCIEEQKMTREVRHDYPLTFAAYANDSHVATAKSMVSDVLLLSFWAAMVPVSMWIGSAAGF
jgi:hypothetical protein